MNDVRHNRAFIAGEGWPWLIAALLAAVGLWRLDYPQAAAVAGFALVLLILLFRDPNHLTPAVPLGIFAPVDGRVREIAPIEDTILRGEWIRMRISVSWFGAYTMRAPIEGTIVEVGPHAMPDTRVSGLWVRSDEQDDVAVLFPRRGPGLTPRAFVRYGERVGQGVRMAYLRLAPTAVVYLPADVRVEVEVGQRVAAGITLLAELQGR